MRRLFSRGWFVRPEPAANAECRSGTCQDARRVVRRLDVLRQTLARARREAEDALARAVRSGSSKGLERASTRLRGILEEERVIAPLTGGWREPLRLDGKGRRIDLVVSSAQLTESFSYCTAAADEGLHVFVGYDLDCRAHVSGMRTFRYESRSVVHATGDMAATHRLWRETREGGHRILAIMHSHPGFGPDANHRSRRDVAGQRNWEPWNRQIGGIWSRDGYVRFWSLELPFSVEVVGAHLEQLEENLWRIRDVGPMAETALALPDA